MSSLIVAKFDTQYAAVSALEKLMSRGLRQEHGVVQCDESVGRSASSSSAPTSVVSQLSHRGEREGEKRAVRAPDVLPNPADMGLAVLTVQIDDDAAIEVVMGVMRGLDALDVHILPGETLPHEERDLAPHHGAGSSTDVDRAISASQRGKRHLH